MLFEEPKVEEPQENVSDFNNKLKTALNFNPKDKEPNAE
jgi:hypothetical protein